MKKEIALNQLNYNEQSIILDIIHEDSILKETFGGMRNTSSRILNSSYAATISIENNIIGFIMLVYNDKDNTHEIDMGIIDRYRSQGYGTIALHKLKEMIERANLNVSIQVKKENIGALKTIVKNDFDYIREDSSYKYYGLKKNIRRES